MYTLSNRTAPLRRPIPPPLETDFIRPSGLPRRQDQPDDILHALSPLDIRKHDRSTFPHPARITLHHAQIRPDRLGKIDFVDDQQIRTRDARPTLPGHFVPARDVNHVDDEIGQFAAVVRGEVVAAGFDEE